MVDPSELIDVKIKIQWSGFHAIAIGINIEGRCSNMLVHIPEGLTPQQAKAHAISKVLLMASRRLSEDLHHQIEGIE